MNTTSAIKRAGYFNHEIKMVLHDATPNEYSGFVKNILEPVDERYIESILLHVKEIDTLIKDYLISKR